MGIAVERNLEIGSDFYRQECDRLRQVNAELVAALEWVLQFDPDGDGGMPDYKELRHVCDTARAALAKSKG
jgi:hypothetical protein